MKHHRFTGRRRPLIALAIVSLLALVATSSMAARTTSSTQAAAGGVATAKALVAKYSAVPKTIGIKTPVPGEIPTGKKIDFMMCGVPSCQAFIAPLKAAAKVLGWSVNVIVAGPTPDKTTAAWNLAVRNRPDAVVSSGFPSVMWAAQLKQLAKMKIPVVECCTTDKPGNGIIFVDTSNSAGVLGGKMQADWVVADSNGRANAVYINIPAYPILASELAGFTAEYKKLCPSCRLAKYDQNVADVGTPAGTAKIVGYLQANPDVNYVVAGADDSLVGLPAALRAAGLGDKIKAIGLAPSTVNLNYIKNDQIEKATISFPNAEIAWKLMDVLARHFVGASLAPATSILPRRILTKDGIVDPNTLGPTTPTYAEEFKALWNKK